jgi:uncharacterized protein (DUF433 family)
MTNLRDRITVKADVCHGKACVRGTRVMVSIILDNLAAGISEENILRNYPTLEAEDIHAALGYAAELTRDRIIAFPPVTDEVQAR